MPPQLGLLTKVAMSKSGSSPPSFAMIVNNPKCTFYWISSILTAALLDAIYSQRSC